MKLDQFWIKKENSRSGRFKEHIDMVRENVVEDPQMSISRSQ